MRKMSASWRKVEDENGFPYYMNEVRGTRQWDHPKFSDIKQKLDDCNWIKYSEYRVATKFRILQQSLHMEPVSLSVIAGVFERHRLGTTESSLYLESYDIEAVLSDIYFASNKQNHVDTDIDFATEIMLNFLYNIYDMDRKGIIQVLQVKLVLAVLSNTNLSDIYHFIFNLCADHNNCVTRLKVQTILSKLADVATYLHEDSSFGQHLVNSSLEDCFSKSPGLVGINESMFVNWLESNPQLLAWLPTLHRLKVSETVVHAAKCSVCKITPILGLKYRCVKCSRYVQCQKCYLMARISHSHKITHPMKEYFSEDMFNEFIFAFKVTLLVEATVFGQQPINITDKKIYLTMQHFYSTVMKNGFVEASSNEITHSLVKKLCGLLRCSVQNNDSQIIEPKPLSIDKDWLLISSQTEKCLNEIEPMSSPHIQLQVIIRQLELQNRDLQQMLVVGVQNDIDMKRYLEDHRLHVAAQIHKLKILKDFLKTPPPVESLQKLTLQSTPMVSCFKNRGNALDLLSPIVQVTECNYSSHHLDPISAKNISNEFDSSLGPTLNDISTWIGGKSTGSANITHLNGNKSPVREMHNDLDEALAKLQQILANNFSLDESLGNIDNGQLKNAVTEVEGMLTSLIDNVESTRASSTQSTALQSDKQIGFLESRYKYS